MAKHTNIPHPAAGWCSQKFWDTFNPNIIVSTIDDFPGHVSTGKFAMSYDDEPAIINLKGSYSQHVIDADGNVTITIYENVPYYWTRRKGKKGEPPFKLAAFILAEPNIHLVGLFDSPSLFSSLTGILLDNVKFALAEPGQKGVTGRTSKGYAFLLIQIPKRKVLEITDYFRPAVGGERK